MTFADLKTYIAVTALACSLLTAGCAAKRDQAPRPSTGAPGTPAPGTPAPAPNNGGGPAPGTSDSGGGTGVAGKVFESYIVDPTALPAFKIVAGLLNNIKSSDTGDNGSWARNFKMKTWYIAPVEFDKVGKDALGVLFMKSDTQQIARQSMKEIWVNKKIYDGMSERDQAELLIHEMVMSMYLMRFMTVTEICKASMLMAGNPKDGDGCGGDNNGTFKDTKSTEELLEKMMPTEKARPLNDKDNENIRYVTGWILQNMTKEVAELDFIRVLAAKDFDQRMFNPKNYDPDAKSAGEVDVTAKEISDAIMGAQITGNMPHLCEGISNGKNKECEVTFGAAELEYSGIKIPAHYLSIKAQGEKEIRINFAIAEQTSLTDFSNRDSATSYMFSAMESRDKIKVGDRISNAMLLFRRDPVAGFILDYIVVQTGIVTSIDKNRTDYICQVRAPRLDKLFDDGLLIKREGFKQDMVSSMVTHMPPSAVCLPSNVD